MDIDIGMEQQEVKEGGEVPSPLEWPSNGVVTAEWVASLTSTLETASRCLRPEFLPQVLPVCVADALIIAASKLLHHEPNCLRIDPDPADPDLRVILVGDIHGQLHDLLHLFQLVGHPSAHCLFVFNGDYVDRGAWGLETYVILLAWKVLLPHRVFLLRGNHETKFCTSAYGFEQEVMSKYGDMGKHLYRKFLGCFEGHPLAAIIAGSVYMAHGGVFRQVEHPHRRRFRKDKHSKLSLGSNNSSGLKLGSLDELVKTRRVMLDPSGQGANAITGDVLWSDPSRKDGLSPNTSRGIGLFWGPDCTEEFLQTNKLKLIVRSHEGPDAREKRSDMEPMDKGYTIDHVVKSGKLITLFSAPDYPQFQAGGKRYKNKAAYIILEHPDFSIPNIFTFEAVLPRPKAKPYYDFANSIDSDEELNLGSGGDSSGYSD